MKRRHKPIHEEQYREYAIEIWRDTYDAPEQRERIGTLLCFRRSFAMGSHVHLIRLPDALATRQARHIEQYGGIVTETFDAHLKGASFEFVVYDACSHDEVGRMPGFFYLEDCVADAKMFVDALQGYGKVA